MRVGLDVAVEEFVPQASDVCHLVVVQYLDPHGPVLNRHVERASTVRRRSWCRSGSGLCGTFKFIGDTSYQDEKIISLMGRTLVPHAQ